MENLANELEEADTLPRFWIRDLDDREIRIRFFDKGVLNWELSELNRKIEVEDMMEVYLFVKWPPRYQEKHLNETKRFTRS